MNAQSSWKEREGKLTSTFEFKNFKDALDFVNLVGNRAEEIGHHPDIFLFDYKNVTFTLFTHDENAITHKDHELAKFIDEMYSKDN